jgi:hypothetical protein
MMTSECRAVIWFVLFSCGLISSGRGETFQDFIKRDRQALEKFSADQKPGAARPKASAESNSSKVRAEVSPERVRAQALYNRYCQLRDTLENGDPKRGYNRRISDLENKLYPTGRPFADWFQWSDDDNLRNYPFLKELIVRRRAIQTEMDALARQWSDAELSSRLHPLVDCYGLKAWAFWRDKSVYPAVLRSNEVDYVGFHLERIWPTNTIPTDANGVYEKEPPAPPEPPDAPEMDESTNNVPAQESWGQMTSDERHVSLEANDADTWRSVYNALVSGATNLIEQVKNALDATGASATPPVISFTNLTPTAVTPAKPWNDMTPQERHEALKNNDNGAWDAVREALLSGDPKQVAVVVEALGARTVPPCNCPRCKPQGLLDCSDCELCLMMMGAPPGTGNARSDAIRNGLLSGNARQIAEVIAMLISSKALSGDVLSRFAYANGYILGRSEKGGRSVKSMLDATATAYEREVDRQAVRAGHADATAGKSSRATAGKAD